MSIIVVVETLRASLGITIRKVAVYIYTFWTSMSMGVVSWYCARKSVNGGGAIVVRSQITYKLQCVGQ